MNLGGPLFHWQFKRGRERAERPLLVKGPPSAHHPSAIPHNPIEVDLMGWRMGRTEVIINRIIL
jgi:hypothetical protein